MGVFLQLIEAILYNSSTHGISVTVCSSMRCTMRIIPDVSGLVFMFQVFHVFHVFHVLYYDAHDENQPLSHNGDLIFWPVSV